MNKIDMLKIIQKNLAEKNYPMWDIKGRRRGELITYGVNNVRAKNIYHLYFTKEYFDILKYVRFKFWNIKIR